MSDNIGKRQPFGRTLQHPMCGTRGKMEVACGFPFAPSERAGNSPAAICRSHRSIVAALKECRDAALRIVRARVERIDAAAFDGGPMMSPFAICRPALVSRSRSTS